ncbi:hypothetical protein HWV62_43335 [Athelia sp. TMB]|nr:hypothetical protein HWV62_43335 [Athelia sp. TMB]
MSSKDIDIVDSNGSKYLQSSSTDERFSKGEPNDHSILDSDLPVKPEDKDSDCTTGPTFELEAFAFAVQALEKVQGIVTGRSARLLALPIDELLSVAKACIVSFDLNCKSRLAKLIALNVQMNYQEEEGLSGISTALIALDGKTDSTAVLWRKLVAYVNSVFSATPWKRTNQTPSVSWLNHRLLPRRLALISLVPSNQPFKILR